MSDPTFRPTPRGWDLTALVPDTSQETLTRLCQELETAVEAFAARRPELTRDMDPAVFHSICAETEGLAQRMSKLGSYASLRFAADTGSADILTVRNRVEQLLTTLSNRTLFFTLWWKDLEDDAAARLLPDVQRNPDLRHWLEDVRRLKPFTLDEGSEQLINTKDANGVDGLLTIYSMLTNRLEFTLDVDGEAQTMTRDELMAHVFSPDADRRAAAYREVHRVFDGEAPLLAQIYANRVRDWRDENVELRGFASPIAVRNAANDIPDQAVEALLDVTTEKAPLFRRYFRWKADRLGLDKLRRSDLYAPLSASDKTIPYGDAVQLVLDTFGDFHPSLAAHAARVFDEDHVDAEIRKGKKGGAFCATVTPELSPWVLLNYTGRVRDVATVAHEMGHAIHSLLAEDHSILTQHAPLPLAETASVFAEMLLTDRLLAEEQDPGARRELLASKLDDIYATVLRQAWFTKFEVAAHEAIVGGASPDDLDAMYLAGLKEQFGDAVELDPAFRREWISIPHIFHTPFYCYAYSFGQLLVLALYRRYKEQGEAFIPGYLRLLAHGGSARPEAILAEADVDMTNPDFWRGGFQVVEDLLDELEALD